MTKSPFDLTGKVAVESTADAAECWTPASGMTTAAV